LLTCYRSNKEFKVHRPAIKKGLVNNVISYLLATVLIKANQLQRLE
jgi:hypothetical protein